MQTEIQIINVHTLLEIFVSVSYKILTNRLENIPLLFHFFISESEIQYRNHFEKRQRFGEIPMVKDRNTQNRNLLILCCLDGYIRFTMTNLSKTGG